MSEEKLAVAYVRVSQPDENEQNQILAIEDFARSRNIRIVRYFIDKGVSGTVPPRKRPAYSQMIQYCKENNIKIIIFYDITRFSRSVEEGLIELKNLLDEGFDYYFVATDRLNYDVPPPLKKKILLDMLWFGELYVEDIRKRTKLGLERLKREGKLYHKPSLLHYITLYYTGKNRFSELESREIDRIREMLRRYFKNHEGLSLRALYDKFLRDFSHIWTMFPNAPRSFTAFYRLYRSVLSQSQCRPPLYD
ncbi:MAG: recombinase family protein [Crenarchaeota archaeon]|nr:recombinase family protein [Thermoproteota archaeon]